jgi:hypothetical protein
MTNPFSVRCAYCCAKPRQSCHTLEGIACTPHPSRVNSFEKSKRILDRVTAKSRAA